MRWADLHRLSAAVPVTASPARRETARASAEQQDESGTRWGKASRFSWSREAAPDDERSFLVEPFDTPTPAYMRVIEATAKIRSERVRVELPENPSVWAEVDRMTRIAFGYTEFPPKPYPSSPQPSRTTVYDLTFVLHPPPEDEAVVA